MSKYGSLKVVSICHVWFIMWYVDITYYLPANMCCGSHVNFFCRSKCYNDNPNLPVYEYTASRYNAQTIVEVLMNPEIPLDKITTTRPVSIQDNVVLIVDLSKLDKPEDIRADDVGSWHCNGKRFVKCAIDDNVHLLTELVT